MLLVVLPGASAFAQIEDPATGVPVKIWVTGTSSNSTGAYSYNSQQTTSPLIPTATYNQYLLSVTRHGATTRYNYALPPIGYQGARIEISSTPAFLPWLLPQSGGTIATGSGAINSIAVAASGGQAMNLDLGTVNATPGATYTLNLTQTNVVGGTINVLPPPGYRVILGGMARSSAPLASNIVMRVVRAGDGPLGAAGFASTLRGSKIDWRLSLGGLRNGDSAGALQLTDSGQMASWSGLYTPAGLSYESASDEVYVYYASGALRQIIANQVAVDIVTLNSTSYQIKCYTPQQITSVVPCTFAGQPFVTYTVMKGTDSGDNDTTLKIIRETRNIVDPNATNAPVARKDWMKIKRSGSFPGFTWANTDWTLEGQSPITGTAFTATGTTTNGFVMNRVEPIGVGAPGSAPAMKLKREYALTAVGEVLTAESLGSDPDLKTTFEYYMDATKPGSFGYVRTVSLPGGGWEGYEYYDPGTGVSYQGGRVQRRYRVYGNATPPVSFDPAVGEVTFYAYSMDPFGFYSRPAFSSTTINGVIVSRSQTTYVDGTDGVVTATRRDYSADTTYLQTVTKFYSENTADALIRGKTISVQQPDGVMAKYTYEHGTWDGTTFTVGTISSTGSRLSVITTTAAGDVAGRTTKNVTIRDERALVVRTESQVWTGTAWQTLSFVAQTFNPAGLPVTRTTSTGATYTVAYDGLLKTGETDDSGLTTNYVYDAAGRVWQNIRRGATTGSGANTVTLADVITRFGYDQAGNVVEQRVGWTPTGNPEQLVSSTAYDDAGRLVSETPAGLGTTLHTYNVQNRTHTATRPDLSTVTETKYADGRLYSKTGTGIVAEFHVYGVEAATGRQWERVNGRVSNSPRWQQTYRDWLGRGVANVRPVYGSTAATFDGNFSSTSVYLEQQFYDEVADRTSTGHVIKTTKTGVAPTRYTYDAFGQVFRSGLDVDRNDSLDPISTDRIGESDQLIELYNGDWWARTETRTYPTAGSGQVIVTSRKRQRLTGHPAGRLDEVVTTDISGNVTTRTTEVNRAAATATITTTTSGVSNAQVDFRLAGQPLTLKGVDGLTTKTGYDALWRKITVKDARGNTTTSTYQLGTTLVQSIKDGTNATVATYAYDTLGRQVTLTDPLNNHVYSSFNLRGQPLRQWGEGTYPVENGYNDYGERTTLKTYRAGLDSYWAATTWPGDPTPSTNPNDSDELRNPVSTTTWAYDPATGLLTAKTDAAGRTVAYDYNDRGQLSTRTWARNLTTTYYYDSNTGEQRDIDYSDSTPDLHYVFNRLGQMTQIEDGTGTRTLTHCFCGKLSNEHLDTTFFGGRDIAYKLEQTPGGVKNRTIGYTLKRSTGATEQDLTYSYSAATGRFTDLATETTAAAGAHTFHYGYLANSGLLETLTVDSGHPFTVTRTFEDQRDVLTSIKTMWSTSTRTRYDYTTNTLGQRTTSKQTGDAFADYGDATTPVLQNFGYDAKGQLTSATSYVNETVDTAKVMWDRQHEYVYDQIGNRQSANRTGNGTLAEKYTTNKLNQLVTKENPVATVSGTADASARVVIGGTGVTASEKASRQGKYWSDNVTVGNGPITVGGTTYANGRPWRGALNIFVGKAAGGPGGTTDLVQLGARVAQIAAQLQTYTYDLDGNVLSDGLWNYVWDAENRLVEMTPDSLAVSMGFPNRRLKFAYDYLGRRVQKLVYNCAVTPNVLLTGRRFVYDGWNLIAEYADTGGTTPGNLIRSYTWGLDIARTLVDAGGVGALLQITDHASGKAYFPSYDGNGNIHSWTNAASTSGSIAAVYEYSPYGEPLRAETRDDSLADQPFRFSTKYTDIETGLVYYGRRYYSPSQGRFVGRDPKGEEGGLHLYGFCRNNSVNLWDYLGMIPPILPPGATPGPGFSNGYTTQNSGLTLFFTPSAPGVALGGFKIEWSNTQILSSTNQIVRAGNTTAVATVTTTLNNYTFAFGSGPGQVKFLDVGITDTLASGYTRDGNTYIGRPNGLPSVTFNGKFDPKVKTNLTKGNLGGVDGKVDLTAGVKNSGGNFSLPIIGVGFGAGPASLGGVSLNLGFNGPVEPGTVTLPAFKVGINSPNNAGIDGAGTSSGGGTSALGVAGATVLTDPQDIADALSQIPDSAAAQVAADKKKIEEENEL